MTPRDPYVWIDPADAVFVTACREALKIERAAYAQADAERRRLRERLNRTEGAPQVTREARR